MRRPPALAVDTSPQLASPTSAYDLTHSPRSSVYSESIDIKFPESPETPKSSPDVLQAPGPVPSISLLFSLLSPRQRIVLFTPAIFFSVISGGIAPFMTVVIGHSFDAFASFPLVDPSRADRNRLLHGVGMAALQLVGLAGGALALSSITSSLWIWTGEKNVMALRTRIYAAVTNKDMEWFDTKMGADNTSQVASEGEQGPSGAGGLMAKFAR
jgi:ATP-binding cassette, subfamily B (MDR/TAP), member 1